MNRAILGKLPGYRDVFVQGFSGPDSGSIAQKLLREFRDERWRNTIDG